MLNPKSGQEVRESLLTYSEMCYNVALKLTENPDAARKLTQEVFMWAWANPMSVAHDAGVKMGLLSKIRETYMENYEIPAVLEWLQRGRKARRARAMELRIAS